MAAVSLDGFAPTHLILQDLTFQVISILVI